MALWRMQEDRRRVLLRSCLTSSTDDTLGLDGLLSENCAAVILDDGDWRWRNAICEHKC